MTALKSTSFEGETLQQAGTFPQTLKGGNRSDDLSPHQAKATLINPVNLSLPELIAHICNTHHAYLNEALPQILWLVRKAVKVHAQNDTNLIELLEVFSAHSEELAMHLRMEEEILFPTILERVAKKAPLLGQGSPIRATLRNWILDHEVEGDGLERLRELADDYAIPPWAGPVYIELMEALRHFEEDMRKHMHLETQILFPKAIAATETR
jgi:regulator of cell morphogenesis and NO signaling